MQIICSKYTTIDFCKNNIESKAEPNKFICYIVSDIKFLCHINSRTLIERCLKDATKEESMYHIKLPLLEPNLIRSKKKNIQPIELTDLKG